jgi:hypothetical protein
MKIEIEVSELNECTAAPFVYCASGSDSGQYVAALRDTRKPKARTP